MNYKKIFLLSTITVFIQSHFVFSLEVFNDGKEHILPEGSNYKEGILISNNSKVSNEGTLSVSSENDAFISFQVNDKGHLILTGSAEKPVNIESKKPGDPQVSASSSLNAEGKDSIIIADKVNIKANAFNNYGTFVRDKASLTITDSEIDTQGELSHGLYNIEEGNAKFNRVNINTMGENNNGIKNQRGAKTIIENSEIKTKGNNSRGVRADDNNSTITVENNTKINTEGNNSYGADATMGGNIVIKDSQITTSGEASHALKLSDGSEIKAINSNIKTTGINSSAIYANDTENEKYKENIVKITGGTIESIKGDLIRSEGGKINVIMKNVPKTSTGSGYILNVLDNDIGHNGLVILDITDTKLQGNIFSAPKGRASLKLNNSQLTGKIDNATDISIDSNSQWSVTDNSTISETTTNNGNIAFENNRNTFKTIKTKNYHGNLGKIEFNTHLADDDSLTDKLIVDGDTSGKTFVKVNNVGGKGALTINGIELIKVKGKSAGEFIQDGRIVAGLYDYVLNKGNQSPQNKNNWYLQSRLSSENKDRQPRDNSAPKASEKPSITNQPSAPEKTVTPNQPSAPKQPVTPRKDLIFEPVYRPEVASYASNLHAANTMFNMTLHQRLGDFRYTDISDNENKATSMWIRSEINHINSSMSDKQNKSKSNQQMIMIGGDIVDGSSNEYNRYILGIMAGYGKQHSKEHNGYSKYSSEGRVSGYSTGLYATWYQNQKEKTGFYVDTWINYNWFNNEVNGQGLNKESYKSKGITASLESGYSFKIGEYKLQNGIFNTFWIQPQAQLTWMNVNANNHTESNGTRVKGNSGNLQSRLGLRAYLYGKDTFNEGKQFYFKPFIETNWIHNSKNFTVKMNGDENYIQGTRNIVELKTGVEMKISNHLHLWGDISQQLGGKNYSNTRGNVGIKYLF